jgi:hypothetical protein
MLNTCRWCAIPQIQSDSVILTEAKRSGEDLLFWGLLFLTRAHAAENRFGKGPTSVGPLSR